MKPAIQVSRLSSGLTVVTERMDRVETVSFGAYVATGSRNETAEENGVSHFLEHMAFKGTERRSAAQIAEEIEAVGGHINAYTAREQTAYYVKVLKEDTVLAVPGRCWPAISCRWGRTDTSVSCGAIRT